MTNIEDKDWSRSEGDSWDIVSSVGFTALGVAAARAVENREADPLCVIRMRNISCAPQVNRI